MDRRRFGITEWWIIQVQDCHGLLLGIQILDDDTIILRKREGLTDTELTPLVLTAMRMT